MAVPTRTWLRLLALAFLGAAAGLRMGAVEYHYKYWRTEDGLPDNQVHCLGKTDDGFLWIGTANGLARFDGQRFEVYDARNQPGFATSDVVNFLATRRHGLLFLTRDGLWLQRLSDGKIVPRFDLVNISRWMEDDSGRAWVVKQKGRLFEVLPTGMREETNSVALDGQPIFAAGRKAPTVFHNGRWREIQSGQWNEVSDLASIPNDNGWRVERLFAGGAWFMLPQEICRVPGTGTNILRIQIPGITDAVTNLRESSTGVLTLVTDNGRAYRIDPVTKTAEPLLGPDGRALTDVIEALPDEDGNIWIGTRGDGLLRLRETAFRIRDHRHGLPSDRLTTVENRSAGGLWIGDREGRVSALVDEVAVPVNHLQRSPTVLMLKEDFDQRLWVGHEGSGAQIVEGLNATRFWSATNVHKAALHWAATALKTSTGDFWVASATLMVRITATNVQRFDEKGIRTEPGALCLAEARDGSIWTGAYESVSWWRDGRWSMIRTSTNTFPVGVFSLLADRDGGVWIGSKGNQLSRYKDGRFAGFPLNQETTDNAVCGIQDDGEGSLWLTTFHGIMRVRKSAFEDCVRGLRRDLDADTFGPDDGLPSGGSAGPADPTLVRDAQGVMHAATLRGLVSFDPRKVFPKFRPPLARVEEIRLERRSFPTPASGTLSVPAGTSQVEIRYTGIQLSQPAKVRFRYRLDGVDQNWVEAGTRRTAYYPRLPPGLHRFHVEAAGADRIWQEPGAEITLQVGAFFWETRTFAVLSAVAVAGVIAWLARLIATRQFAARLATARRQAAVERERARISRDMHDDLGARLTKIAFYTELAERDGDPKVAREHLHSVARMSREAAQALDEMVWAVKPANDTLANLANYLCQYATEYLVETPIRLRLDFPMSVAPHPLPSEVRHQVFLVIKEALNNVVKHADAHEVLLRLQPDTDRFRIELTDDGVGIAVDPILGSPTGNGLQNMRQRIDQIGGKLTLRKRSTGGTELRIEVPLPPARATD